MKIISTKLHTSQDNTKNYDNNKILIIFKVKLVILF